MRSLAALVLFATASFAHADPKAEVYAAWDAMVAAKSYRATLSSEAGGQTSKQTIEIVIPTHMRMSGGASGDMVVTPEGAWIRIPGQDWMAAPPGTTEVSKRFLSPAFIEEAKAGVRSVQALGEEQLAGKPVRTYQIEQVMTVMGIATESSTKLYVDVASGRPVRQEVAATAMGRNSRTVQDIEYVQGLEIVAPE
ncbi:MAG: hypothetical protein IT479_13750 [Xanthomonadales bacterium]|nr:hypothetical protein [Xanthomonadales bacterium]MCC6594323.1 hypothetical protein [Xanthomonadales bacterium]MCE7931392.1 hypothetical protein [Xanthomonadales bacterium PRO6]